MVNSESHNLEIREYSDSYQQQVIELILNIQQNEFHVPITIEDQPGSFNDSVLLSKSNPAPAQPEEISGLPFTKEKLSERLHFSASVMTRRH